MGHCVNLAARIMCSPECRGKVFCDEDTYLEAKHVLNFRDETLSLVLKGKLGSLYVAIY
jgi:hypothetical protein